MTWYAIIGDDGFVYDVFRVKAEAIEEQKKIWIRTGDFAGIVGYDKKLVKKAVLEYLRKKEVEKNE